MAEVTHMVIKSEDGEDTQELRTVNLLGVPRVGETVIASGAIFEVRKVVWCEEFVSLDVYSEKYGISFPMPRGTAQG